MSCFYNGIKKYISIKINETIRKIGIKSIYVRSRKIVSSFMSS